MEVINLLVEIEIHLVKKKFFEFSTRKSFFFRNFADCSFLSSEAEGKREL